MHMILGLPNLILPYMLRIPGRWSLHLCKVRHVKSGWRERASLCVQTTSFPPTSFSLSGFLCISMLLQPFEQFLKMLLMMVIGSYEGIGEGITLHPRISASI